MGAPHDETLAFEGQQHLVGRLRRHERAPGQLGVRKPVTVGEHAEGGVLVDREPLLLHGVLYAPAYDAIEPADEVQQRRHTRLAGVLAMRSHARGVSYTPKTRVRTGLGVTSDRG